MQFITGGAEGNASIGAGDVRYCRVLSQSSSWTATIAARQEVVPTSGYFKFFRGLANGSPGVGEGWTFYININGSDSALSFSITGTATSGADMRRKARVAAGDLVCIKALTILTPTARQVMFSVAFVPDKPRESIIMGGVSINHTSPTTYYQGLAIEGRNGPVTTADVFNNPIPKKCRLKKMYVKIDVAPAGAASWTFTLRKVGAAQTVTVSIVGAATSGNDTTHVDSAAVGEAWGMQIVPAGGPATFASFNYGLVIEFDEEGYSLQCTSIWTGSSTVATNYIGQIGCTAVNATEAVVAAPVQPCRLSNFYVRVGVAPGAGNSYFYTLRRNSVDTPITCTSTGAAPGGLTANDTTHFAVYRMDDTASIEMVPDSGPTTQSNIQTSCVQYIEPNQTLLNPLGCGHGARRPHADNQGGLMRKMRKRAR